MQHTVLQAKQGHSAQAAASGEVQGASAKLGCCRAPSLSRGCYLPQPPSYTNHLIPPRWQAWPFIRWRLGCRLGGRRRRQSANIAVQRDLRSKSPALHTAHDCPADRGLDKRAGIPYHAAQQGRSAEHCERTGQVRMGCAGAARNAQATCYHLHGALHARAAHRARAQVAGRAV